MLLKTTIIGVLAGLTSVIAFAGEGSAPSQVTLDQLRARCHEYANNPQIKPFTATLNCDETSYFWRATAPGQFSLNNTRNVGATITMKGMLVPHQVFPMNPQNLNTACQNFEQVERVVPNVSIQLSCADLDHLDNLAGRCAQLIDNRAAQDPGVVSERTTGETRTTCGGVSPAAQQPGAAQGAAPAQKP